MADVTDAAVCPHWGRWDEAQLEPQVHGSYRMVGVREQVQKGPLDLVKLATAAPVLSLTPCTTAPYSPGVPAL